MQIDRGEYFFESECQRKEKLNTRHRLLPKLQMCGAKPLCPYFFLVLNLEQGISFRFMEEKEHLKNIK
jgi:hypothetical protein